MPRLQYILHLDPYSQPVLGHIFWSLSCWQAHSATPDPLAAIVTASYVFHPHARHISKQLYNCGNGPLVAKVSIVHLLIQLHCLIPYQQSHKSPTLHSGDTLCTGPSFANLYVYELWRYNRSTSSPSIDSFICKYHPIVHICSFHCCHCLCKYNTVHYCIASTIPCNVPYLMASLAFLSIPLNDAATHMLLMFHTATITLTATITGLPGRSNLLWILHLALCPCLIHCQQFDAFQVEFLLSVHFVGFYLHNYLLQCVGQ